MARRENAPMEALRAEVERLRAQNEEIQAALYDLQVGPPATAEGRELSYRQLVRRIRETVRAELPPDATVLVASKGDRGLLDLYGRPAWHFPRDAEGRYAGYYPKTSVSAIAHLEAMRARGADYLLLPSTALWWLDHYAGLRRHVGRRYREVVYREGTCTVYSLREPPDPRLRSGLELLEDAVEEYEALTGTEPAILDWTPRREVEAALPECAVFSPRDGDPTELPYLDGSVDVVVVDAPSPLRAAEAERVAAAAVVDLGAEASAAVAWKQRPAGTAPPSVSIVIPCHDGAELTRACLSTLGETLPSDFEGEIVVVDDRSSDGTTRLLGSLRRADSRLRVLRNRKNLGFLGSCNRGAEAASGDYLLFLNNDTVLLPGWLPPLLRTFRDFPAAGAVGGKLLFEDGRLQEAGAVVFADGSAAKFGYREPDAEAPLYSYVREVDYVSAALLATPRSLFAELGGFDPRYGFGYYDDVDYCFTVRAAGRRVYFQPEGAIVHVEGGAAGTDLSTGLKRYQARNQSVFAAKWRDVLRHSRGRPDVFDRHILHDVALQPPRSVCP